MKRILLIFLGMAVSVLAEEPWPKSVLKPKFVETSTNKLPKALRNALLEWDAYTQGSGKLPGTLDVCRVDLKGDGSDDYVVQSNQDYSGGPQMDIFEQHRGKYVRIGGAQGRVYFAARVNGYLQIVDQGASGAGQYTRCLRRYKGDRYHLVRLTDYQMREQGEVLDFVRERDTKGNDF